MSELIPLILSSNYNKFEVSGWDSFEVVKHVNVMMDNFQVWPSKNYHPQLMSGKKLIRDAYLEQKNPESG